MEDILRNMERYLSYNPETGLFMRIKSGGGRYAKEGDVAGGKDKDGYIVRGFKGKKYKAYRLAFWFVDKIIVPRDREIDHINMVVDDNRFCNLRIATKSENCWNRVAYNNNTSGYRGVYFNKRLGMWSGDVKFNGERIFLGYSHNKEDIREKYKQVSSSLRGEFNRV